MGVILRRPSEVRVSICLLIGPLMGVDDTRLSSKDAEEALVATPPVLDADWSCSCNNAGVSTTLDAYDSF